MKTQTICLKSHYQPVLLDEARIILHSEADSHLLTGELYVELIPLLNGSCTKEEIAEKLSSHYPIDWVYFALRKLERGGHIKSNSHSGSLDQSALVLLDALGADTDRYTANKANFSVQLRGFGPTQDDIDGLSDALAKSGLKVAPGPAALTLVVTDDYLRPELHLLITKFIREHQACLLCKTLGKILWIGPWVTSPPQVDWDLLLQRLRQNQAYLSTQSRPTIPLGSLPCSRAVAWQLVVTEIHKFLALRTATVLNENILTFDIESMSVDRHPLPRREPNWKRYDHLSAWPLRSAQKIYTQEGGFRTCPVEQTIARLEKHISPYTGIISQVSRYDTGPGYSYSAFHTKPLPNAIDGNVLRRAPSDATSTAAGKGATDAQAKASCLAEAVERHSYYFQGNEPRKVATLANLGDQAVCPDHLQNFSTRQYQNRDAINAREPAVHHVPERFDPDSAIEWTANWSLTHSTTKWLPSAFCYFGHPDQSFCRANTNGCASGNTMEEAIVQGFLELVERDAVAIWWYNRLRRPGIDLESFPNPFHYEMLRRHRYLNRQLIALDVTADLGVPTVVALSAREDGSRVHVGLGAHFDIQVAISRALSEMNQSAPFNPDDRSDNLLRNQFGRSQWLKTGNIQEHPNLLPASEVLRTSRDYSAYRSVDILDDIAGLKELASKAGLEILLLDLTRPDVDFPTVKVTVPGMRHYWARFGPGRLYEVPVRLGWLPKPLDETELNPLLWIG